MDNGESCSFCTLQKWDLLYGGGGSWEIMAVRCLTLLLTLLRVSLLFIGLEAKFAWDILYAFVCLATYQVFHRFEDS